MIRSKRCISVFLLNAFCWYVPVAEAIVNIENVRLTEPPQGWSGSVDLGAEGEKGNTDTFSVNRTVKSY